jgi:hypothetical protein
MTLYTTTKRIYHGMVGREYDEYMIVYDTHYDSISILHVGTFADEGFISTVNPNSRRYAK